MCILLPNVMRVSCFCDSWRRVPVEAAEEFVEFMGEVLMYAISRYRSLSFNTE